LGPGWISGAADDDPSGIATYSQAGAQFGFTTLWMALFIPLIIATGVANMREHGVATTSTDNIVS
jgi:Mn2+/Fe2+ NRAMP family transporter